MEKHVFKTNLIVFASVLVRITSRHTLVSREVAI